MKPFRSALLVTVAFVACIASAQDGRFERVLFPIVVTDHPGAFGTVWSTEALVRNESEEPAEIFSSECYYRRRAVGCVITFCPPAEPVAPGATFFAIGSAETGPRPNPGAMLYIQKPMAARVAAHLVLHEKSRRTSEFGVEIPVVRESELFETTLQLPAVAVDGAARTHLRMYGVESPDGSARLRLRVYPGDSVTSVLDTEVELTSPASLTGATPRTGVYDEPQPSYAMVEIDPSLANGTRRVRIRVDSLTAGLKFWAMASVTSNATQHVTIVSPQRCGKTSAWGVSDVVTAMERV